MHLRTLHALLFAAVAGAVALCGSGAALMLTGERFQAQIGTESAALAGQVRNLLDRSMYGRWRDVRILAASARTAAPTPALRRVWLDAMRETFPAYAWIGFADLGGTVTASTGGVLEGASVAERPWFKAGLKGVAAGDLHAALLLERYLPAAPDGAPWRFVDVSAPVFDAEGRPEGVVGAHLSWNWARELTDSVIAPAAAAAPGTEVLVVDERGVVILGPPELQWKTLPEASAAWREAARGDDYAVERWPGGADYLVGASRTRGMSDYPGLGWTVLVRRPVALAFAPAQALARDLLAGGLVLALAAAAAGVLIGRRVSRPLLRLADAADASTRPPFAAVAFPAEGPSEVRRLAGALDRMWRAVAERDAELADANRSLEARVEARTRELEAMRRTAEQASLAKTDFLAAMSHEIRTPLNGVIGYTDLLADEGGLSPTQAQRVERIRSSGAALLTIVNDILDFSAIEAGAVELHPRPFDLGALVEETLGIVSRGAAVKGLALGAEIDSAARGAFLGDADRLRQVLLNLLNNAIKFTQRGSVALAVGLRGEDAQGCRLTVSVRDTGIGIAADARDRLFQRFSQVDGTIRRRFGGTGLGLAITKRLVELMGGGIAVESVPGEGSTFTVEVVLPRTDPVAAAPAAARTASRGGLRILVAEDVAVNRDILSAVLRAAGHEVVAVEDGAAALEAIAERAFDLVLMDVQMPGMDGLTATRHIRALPGAAGRLPIIALTANVLPDQVAEFRRAGMDDHVAKPFRRDDLHAAIARLSAAAPARAA